MNKKFSIIPILGRPGSGKGTQSAFLAKEFNLKIISSGGLLRERAEKEDFIGTKIKEILNTGGLMPTPIIFDMWLHELESIQEKGEYQGIVFEGSPRKVYEAFLLDEIYQFYELEENFRVIHLSISKEESEKRLLMRGRADDSASAIAKRMEWYEDEVVPVIEHYRKQGKLVEVNGNQDVKKVQEDMETAVSGLF
ncbi:MAG: nucleoside monophosphate kinase [bacterium]|nr:nucleoside monophosphate kinase [bacterium]